MYGQRFEEVLPRVRGRDLLVVVGAEKVPRELYDLVDWNVAIGNQPHSEVAALAIFLERVLGPGAWDRDDFAGRVRIRPSARGKDVIESES
jgi:tRNA (cytidine56-2'-O)-methyltransferase